MADKKNGSNDFSKLNLKTSYETVLNCPCSKNTKNAGEIIPSLPKYVSSKKIKSPRRPLLLVDSSRCQEIGIILEEKLTGQIAFLEYAVLEENIRRKKWA